MENNQNQSSLHKRKIETLREWCVNNNYPGVTKECILSASQSDDPKLRDMAKSAKLINLASDDQGLYGRK